MELVPKIDRSPFKDVEKTGSNSATFYDVPGHPELFARFCHPGFEIKSETRREKENAQSRHNGVPVEEAREIADKKIVNRLIEQSKQFRAIVERYHLPAVPMNYVIGRDPESGERGVLAITDKIEKMDYPEDENLCKKIAQEQDEIFSNGFKHFKDAYIEGGYLWGDFNSSQFMYGAKYGESESRTYLVDIDPNIIKLEKPGDPGVAERRFWDSFFWAFYGIEAMEETIGHGVEFSKSRKMAKELLDVCNEPSSDIDALLVYSKLRSIFY